MVRFIECFTLLYNAQVYSRHPSDGDTSLANKQKWPKYTTDELEYMELNGDLAHPNKVGGGVHKGQQKPHKCAFWNSLIPDLERITDEQSEKDKRKLNNVRPKS